MLPSPGGSLPRHMPSLSIASANKEVKSVLDSPNSVGCGKYSVYTEEEKFKVAKRAAELSIDRKREVSKLNVGVVLIIAIR